MGLLSFNIDLCDCDADENTPYVSGKNIDEVVRFLEESSRVIFKWFNDNQFQASPSKCHVSSNVNDVIRAVLNSLFLFFLQKDFTHTY